MIKVQQEDFDTGAIMKLIQADNPSIGAVVSFVGQVREINGESNSSLSLEHYPGMTEKALELIDEEAKQRWDLIDTTIIHRVGELKPTDQIVLVVVCSKHRKDAFHACEFIMDYLKTRAPFWKKETTEQQSKWVEAKQSDNAEADKW